MEDKLHDEPRKSRALVLAKKEIYLLQLALENSKFTGDYSKWAPFIRTREANITWQLMIHYNGYPKNRGKNYDTKTNEGPK